MGLYADYIFPRFYDLVVQHKTFDALRANFLESVEGKILEIGIGTGLNLSLYPKRVTEITAIDPNPGMEREFKQKLQNCRVQVNFFRTGAEALPFADESFETVVSTLTLCTIPNLPKALAEIRRVLSPTGKFIFLEHGLSPDRWIANLQAALNPIQRRIGCGCQLTVDVSKELRSGGFVINSVKQYYLSNAPRFIGSVYEGAASKQ